jgi:hypothetical protein
MVLVAVIGQPGVDTGQVRVRIGLADFFREAPGFGANLGQL